MSDENQFGWRPKKWIAVTLSVLIPPLGLLYVQRPRLAAIFLLTILSIASLYFFHLGNAFSQSAMSAIQLVLPFAGAVMSYRIAARFVAQEVRPWYTRWFGMVGICVVVIAVFGSTRAFLYEPYRSPSNSMAPAIEQGSMLFVQKWGYGHYSTYGIRFASRPSSIEVKRGDVIVFDYPLDPSITYVKRIVGVPGDKITYKDNHLSLNGQDTQIRKLDDYLRTDRQQYSDRFLEQIDGTQYETLVDSEMGTHYPTAGDFEFKDKCSFDLGEINCVVPPNHYFVLGDYRTNSSDSRLWGFVRSDQIIGKVVKIIR